MKEKISSDNAPSAIGPYSQAIKVGDMVFVSGQIALDLQSGELVSSDIKEQTKIALENIRNILKEAGFEMNDVVKTTVFLADINDFSSMNDVYKDFFEDPFPARAAFQVVALPKGAKVEIEVIAKK